MRFPTKQRKEICAFIKATENLNIKQDDPRRFLRSALANYLRGNDQAYKYYLQAYRLASELVGSQPKSITAKEELNKDVDIAKLLSK